MFNNSSLDQSTTLVDLMFMLHNQHEIAERSFQGALGALYDAGNIHIEREGRKFLITKSTIGTSNYYLKEVAEYSTRGRYAVAKEAPMLAFVGRKTRSDKGVKRGPRANATKPRRRLRTREEVASLQLQIDNVRVQLDRAMHSSLTAHTV